MNKKLFYLIITALFFHVSIFCYAEENETLYSTADIDKWNHIFENSHLYPDVLLKDLKRNPEMLSFVDGYLTADTKAVGELTETEKKEPFPLFIQWDERWGYAPYGTNNIGISGCGPTCLSMVLYSLTRNEDLTPDMLAAKAMNEGYYIDGVGTSWSFMTEVAPQYGVYAVQETTWTKDAVELFLNDGKLLICSMGPGDFTDTGHFIVITDYEDGKVKVNDPFSYSNSNKQWDYDTIASQCNQMWTYEVPATFQQG